jgi:hypothetical protein
MHTKIWLENLKGRNHSQDLGVDGKVILERILWKWDGKMWIGFIWLRWDQWRALVNPIMNFRVP